MASHGKDNRGTKEFRDRAVLMGSLIPLLSVFLIGYPLGRGTIRAILIGWALIVVATMQFFLSHCFQAMRSTARPRTIPTGSTE